MRTPGHGAEPSANASSGDIIVAASPGGGPHVKVFGGRAPQADGDHQAVDGTEGADTLQDAGRIC